MNAQAPTVDSIAKDGRLCQLDTVEHVDDTGRREDELAGRCARLSHNPADAGNTIGGRR
jgi:hypothetical protein